MKRIAIATAILVASTAAAQAETFSFSSTGRVNKNIGGPMVGGPPALVGISTEAGQTTWASGATVTTQSTCANWTSAPGAQFPYSGVCDIDLSNGDIDRMAFGCKALGPDASEANCWGSLSGLSGSRAGRIGTVSFHIWGFSKSPSLRTAGAGWWPD